MATHRSLGLTRTGIQYSYDKGGQIVVVAVPAAIEVALGAAEDPNAASTLGTLSSAAQETFEGTAEPSVLAEDMAAYRYSTISGTPGRWLTLDPNLNPTEARASLALPNDNLATSITQYIIPKGTTIWTGMVAAQTESPGFGPYATEGGFQIYVANSSVLQPVPLLPGMNR